MANRFATTIPGAIPWRERRHRDALVASLINHVREDVGGFLVGRARVHELRQALQKALEIRVQPVMVRL